MYHEIFVKKSLLAKPHYATSVGDNELAEMVRDQWAKTLDDAWIVDYSIMHQWPRPENSFAILKQNGQGRWFKWISKLTKMFSKILKFES